MMILFLSNKNDKRTESPHFYSACRQNHYYIYMAQIKDLKNQSSFLFSKGKFTQGYPLIKRCIEVQPNQPSHYINKALYQHQLGNTKAAFIDLNKAIALDCLNYQAYYNLFSLHMQTAEYEPAFKNICCCLSIAYLLRGYQNNNLDDVQKSIDFSFNNKEARLFRSVLKMQDKKNIQALNSINYALYLAPTNPHLKEVQKKVYQLMGMKELKANNNNLKDKFDRLQTNKEIPTSAKIKEEIGKLLKQFNKMLKSLDTQNLYKVNIQSKIQSKVDLVEPKLTKKLSPKFFLENSEHKEQKATIFSETLKEKDEKESTANNSQHIQQANRSQTFKLNGQILEKGQHFYLDDSFSNLSISNIQQNSNIKSSKCKQAGQYSIGSILESSVSEEKGLGVTLPLKPSQLKGKEIIITLKRSIQNEKGQKEEIEQQFNVVQSNNRFELLKIRK